MVPTPAQFNERVRTYINSLAAHVIVVDWLGGLQAGLEAQGFRLSSTRADGATVSNEAVATGMTAEFYDAVTEQMLALTVALTVQTEEGKTGQSYLMAFIKSPGTDDKTNYAISVKCIQLSTAKRFKGDDEQVRQALSQHVKSGLESVANTTWPRAINEFVAEVCAYQSL